MKKLISKKRICSIAMALTIMTSIVNTSFDNVSATNNYGVMREAGYINDSGLQANLTFPDCLNYVDDTLIVNNMYTAQSANAVDMNAYNQSAYVIQSLSNNYNLNNSIDSQKKLIDEYICKSPRYMCDTWKELKKINNTVNYVPSETVLKHLNPVDMFELPDRRVKFCVYQEINGYWPIAVFKSSCGYNTTRELVCMKNCKSRKEAYNSILDAMAVFQNGCYSGMVPTYRY